MELVSFPVPSFGILNTVQQQQFTEVIAMVSELYSDEWPQGYLQNKLSGHDQNALVALEGGTIAGCASYSLNPETSKGWIEAVVVDEQHRKSRHWQNHDLANTKRSSK